MSQLVLRPYQAEGVDFLAARRNALLAFDTRLGKTLVSLRAAERVGARRILVFAPAIGRLSWEAECPKATTLPVAIVRHPSQFAHLSEPDIVAVLAYDALSHDRHGLADLLASCPPWDVLILDEAQYLKTVGANRTQAIYGRVIHNARRCWLLSGTPTPNHAGEMYSHYLALWPDSPPLSRHQFEDRFCKVQNTPWGRRIAGSQNQAELRDKLAPHVLRRRKWDVIKDLPRVAHNMIPVEVAASGVAMLPVGDTELEQLLASPTGDEARSVRRRLGLDKTRSAASWLQEQLAQNIIDKVIVFAWHRDVLDGLARELADFMPARIDGGTPEGERRGAVASFQKAPGCRVFLGQIKACGTALCLDAADDVVFVEPSWVPMDNYQAASRAEDVARKKPVTVSWLYAAGTLDEQIMQAMRRKTKEIGQIWD